MNLSLPRFSNLLGRNRVDLVAQLVEHLTFNQGVMGSSPIEITLNINGLWNEGSVSRFLFAYNLHTYSPYLAKSKRYTAMVM